MNRCTCLIVCTLAAFAEPKECSEVYSVLADGHSCGSRIKWLVTAEGMAEADAEQAVGKEYPLQCGPCDNPAEDHPQPYVVHVQKQPDMDPCSRYGRSCTLIVDDSFDGTSIDRSVWNVEVRNDGINDEQQAYVEGGVSVRDGLLTLRLFYDSHWPREECNADAFEYLPREGSGLESVCYRSERRPFSGFYSGRINTMGKVNLRHGVIEARVRLASNNPYAWSALWLLGSDVATVGWPHCGESEMAEMWASTTDFANEHRGEVGVIGYGLRPAATLHSFTKKPPEGSYEEVQRNKNGYVALNSAQHPALPGFNASGFNVYRYEKMPRKVSWFVNGQPTVEAFPDDKSRLRIRVSDGERWSEAYGQGSWQPFEREMSLLFNLAFASPWNHRDAARHLGGYRREQLTLDTAAIDWVRVWRL